MNRELIAQKGPFSEFLIEYLQEHEDEEGKNQIWIIFNVHSVSYLQCQSGMTPLFLLLSELKDIKIQLDSEHLLLRSSSRFSATKPKRKGSRLSNQELQEPKPDPVKAPEASDKLIETEEAAVGDVAFNVYIRYFKSVGSRLVIMILFFAMCSETSSALANREQKF